jgi:hypothetical protein
MVRRMPRYIRLQKPPSSYLASNVWCHCSARAISKISEIFDNITKANFDKRSR